jgi:hypothetical protein
MANVVIDIAAEFTGNKAFKQAETSTEKLTKNVKKLAGAVGLAFGTTQVLAFGRAAVKASLEAQAQQERLANLVKVTVGATDAQVQALNEQADALQAIGVVNKENITQTQSQLATFNLQIDTIKALTPAILDYVTAEKGASASADQFKQMTNGLAQALNGNFASLTKVGFVLDDVTKKTIKEGTETERAAALVKVLDSTYKDFNKNLANTPTGQMQKLANAADDAKQIIGTGLLDALTGLGEDDSIQNLANNMAKFATETANVIRGIGILAEKLKSIPGASGFMKGLQDVYNISYLKLLSNLGKVTAAQKSSDNSHLKSLNYQFFVLRKTETLTKKLTAEELKKLKAKQLQNAIDKANLALNKGVDVFDIDQIQIGAALTNQAEQLAKSTSGAQVLQIANDTARLNVKRAILDLEKAIAAGDTVAIEKAVARLGKELSILHALDAQVVKLVDIKSVLDSLSSKVVGVNVDTTEALNKIKALYASASASIVLPVDTTDAANKIKALFTNPAITLLVNTQTEEAINKIKALYASAAQGIVIPVSLSGTATSTDATTGLPGAPINIGGLFTAIGSNFKEYLVETGAFTSGIKPNGGEFNYNISVNTGIGDPAAIANTIVEFLNAAKANGTLANGILNPI